MKLHNIHFWSHKQFLRDLNSRLVAFVDEYHVKTKPSNHLEFFAKSYFEKNFQACSNHNNWYLLVQAKTTSQR